MICGTVEPCHTGDCDGLSEVVALLPQGRLWNPDRSDLYGRTIHALGHIKTELNKRICQEWQENNPCTSKRLFTYWAKLYNLPSCAPQTQASMCAWLDLIYGDCPIGSLGFYRRAIEFVAPGKGITMSINVPDIGANCWCPASPCASENPIVISAPPSAYRYYNSLDDGVIESQDEETCRVYYIPEIECLKKCVFPFGLGVGYLTNPIGPNGQDIFGVPEANIGEKSVGFYSCTPVCKD